MKITEAQLRHLIREQIDEPAVNSNTPLDPDAYQQGFEDGEDGIGPADSKDESYMMGWNVAVATEAYGGYGW